MSTHGTCFDKGRSYAHNGDEENAGRVVVILIDRPEKQTCYLEDIERMKCLHGSACI